MIHNKKGWRKEIRQNSIGWQKLFGVKTSYGNPRVQFKDKKWSRANKGWRTFVFGIIECIRQKTPPKRLAIVLGCSLRNPTPLIKGREISLGLGGEKFLIIEVSRPTIDSTVTNSGQLNRVPKKNHAKNLGLEKQKTQTGREVVGNQCDVCDVFLLRWCVAEMKSTVLKVYQSSVFPVCLPPFFLL